MIRLLPVAIAAGEILHLIQASIARWEAKARRAKNAIAKLQRRAKYYEKKIAP